MKKTVADLFGTRCPAITKHLSNIFKSGELEDDPGLNVRAVRIFSDISEHRSDFFRTTILNTLFISTLQKMRSDRYFGMRGLL